MFWRPSEESVVKGENDQWGQMRQIYQERRGLRIDYWILQCRVVGEVGKRWRSRGKVLLEWI